DEETTERFLYDYRKTLGDLLVDAYYRTARQTSRQAGLGVESEAGGPGPPIHNVPVDALKAQGAVDEMRGEFWPKRPEAHHLWVVKETACAAHIYGRRRVHMEAFTSFHHWQDGPFDLKPSADRAFCEGANHFVWHTAAHAPPEAGKPGWAYGAGTHLGTNLVWWPFAPAFLDYLARCSFLLQQGRFVADVCYYYGDQGFNFVPPKHVDPSLGFGYDYDVTNAEVLLTRMSVRDGRLVLPDGMTYELLVLPDRPDIDLDVLRRLDQLIRAGATVVGPKPVRSNGLADYERRDAEVQRLADAIWGPCDGQTVLEHAYGKGRVIWGRRLREVLQRRGLPPDFRPLSPHGQASLDFVHRRTSEADIYFVRNKTMQPIDGRVVFRVRGRAPEVWLPETGQIHSQVPYRIRPDGIEVPLRLSPAGSVFVVFRRPLDRLWVTAIDWEAAGNTATSSSGKSPTTQKGQPLPQLELLGWSDGAARLLCFSNGSGSVEFSDGSTRRVDLERLAEPKVLDGPWHVHFTKGWGAPESMTFPQLISWTDHANEGIRYYSGIATYQRSFDVPADWLGEDRRVFLDLGDLWAVGEVSVNGRKIGVVWKPPFRLDVTAAVRPGRNQLLVKIANTWSNRLVGDARGIGGRRYCRTNIRRSAGQPWSKVPLRPSGLFGPVRLLPSRVIVAIRPNGSAR
ncbi:MAG: glycoside hydrolase family 2, partial [Planctomycetes bacterium]|nr:glycoside hydrolase family 2 [Planctomycetota bacterium]